MDLLTPPRRLSPSRRVSLGRSPAVPAQFVIRWVFVKALSHLGTKRFSALARSFRMCATSAYARVVTARYSSYMHACTMVALRPPGVFLPHFRWNSLRPQPPRHGRIRYSTLTNAITQGNISSRSTELEATIMISEPTSKACDRSDKFPKVQTEILGYIFGRQLGVSPACRSHA